MIHASAVTVKRERERVVYGGDGNGVLAMTMHLKAKSSLQQYVIIVMQYCNVSSFLDYVFESQSQTRTKRNDGSI